MIILTLCTIAMKDEQLIPEIKDWKENNKNFSIEDWINCNGNASLAIGYLSVFWPNFKTHDNCTFIESHFSSETFTHWKTNGELENYGQLENLINHIHILDIFHLEEGNNLNKEQVLFLGSKLREMLEAKLKMDFPNKSFTVWFNSEEQFEDLIEYQVSFHQNDNFNRKIKSA